MNTRQAYIDSLLVSGKLSPSKNDWNWAGHVQFKSGIAFIHGQPILTIWENIDDEMRANRLSYRMLTKKQIIEIWKRNHHASFTLVNSLSNFIQHNYVSGIVPGLNWPKFEIAFDEREINNLLDEGVSYVTLMRPGSIIVQERVSKQINESLTTSSPFQQAAKS